MIWTLSVAKYPVAFSSSDASMVLARSLVSMFWYWLCLYMLPSTMVLPLVLSRPNVTHNVQELRAIVTVCLQLLSCACNKSI